MVGRMALGWTLVRAVFGLALGLGHGLPKVTGDMSRFAAGVAELGFPFPLFFAWCASLAELVGGVLVAVGLFTRPAAAMAGFTMLVALFRHRADPFGRMELALLYLTVMVAVALIGGGPWSLDSRVRRKA
ncbi:DoxX family protein [Myxococcus llanfairpwllgwyngyllgogerychwyrndrobwllllantysiliogogogochensis]|uniref:DoxX family protein n=1 Tax=Myxococcus llanfairpwllgwyngyllgogerychwyrndrobwllllantysiliogogogochensis TaxID=2590453 RepID=A0A540WU84_9BACT|nr:MULTISPECIES: DoxX family protein [Myxococcus]NTX12165.1 DoxX family protein [Myxococcus sp. CA056]NTX33179.1 DoxX family protein [Myxococcus sp. CA033]NTX54416.1 DoxX family protein [Myxococcus sp. CA039A]TQF12563.1 DoxX family protein [Myxococcus llanfairpwllgwyngyllgogerychwyrndrobwllllantysiliogogogochensis]